MSIHAFEIARFSESIFKAGSKASIECIDVYENHLFVGSSDGVIRHYVLQPEEQPDGLTLIHSRRPGDCLTERAVAKSKIQRIMAIQSLHALLVLIDGRLTLFNIRDLSEIESRHLKSKSGIKLYCRDSGVSLGSARTCEVILTQPRRGISSIELFNDGGLLTVAPHRQFKDMPEEQYRGFEVAAMCRDGFTMCLAFVNPPRAAKYVLYNLASQVLTELFEFDVAHTFPLIARVGLGEFLLTVWTDPQTMGMFANSKGSTTRAPIEFVEAPQQIAFVSPYLLSYCAHTQLVAVHSVLDQQQKQVLEATSLRTLCEADEELYYATGDRLSLIKPVSFEDQIAQLLGERRVGEALQLAQTAYGRGQEAESAEMRKQHLAAVFRAAGLIQLTDGVYAEGTDNLFRAGVDPRVVISLFPGLQLKPLPVRLDEQLLAAQKALKPLEPPKLMAAYNALISYLLRVRHHPQLLDIVDTALTVALALVSPKRLVEFVQGQNRAIVAECSTVLRQQGCLHAYAILLGQSKQYREALELWKSLELGEAKDPTYPGLSFVVSFLATVPDASIVLAHAADWILSRDPKAVSLFMPPIREGETPRTRFEPDEVVNVLRSFPEANDVYLEYLVFALKNDEERFHTKLALSLLDRVTRSPDDPALNRKLLSHLVQSSRFDVATVLRRVENTSMYATRAILYGKQGQHAKALDIFIHTLKDTEAAEQYCREYTVGKSREDRCALYLSLLEVYIGHSADPIFRTRAIDLLNAHTTELDLTKALPLIPGTWGAGAIRAFLWRSVHTNLHVKFLSRIERGLAKSHQISVFKEHAQLTSRAVVITEDSNCEVCDGRLGESSFARFPNGRLVHERCMRTRDTDPVTGATFD